MAIRSFALNHMDRLAEWFTPYAAGLDERQLSARHMFVDISLITALFALLYVATSLWIGFYIGVALMASCFVLLFVALFYFRSTGNLRRSANAYMANCALVAVLGCSFFTGGPRSPVVPWFTLIPVAAVLLFGYSRDAYFWFLVCFGIPLAYCVASLQGYVYPQLYDLRYATVFDMVCVGGLVSVLFVVAQTFDRNTLQAMHQVLDGREKMENLARTQERMAERERILRNMHDGVGSHISSAMRQLEAYSGGDAISARGEVLQTLRDGLDHLKLSIDAIHLAPGDVTALLANMRYRLGPRFAVMGIDLQWDVEQLPVCQPLDASGMTELQFMLFEALSNVLQHAKARVLRVEGHARSSDMAATLEGGAPAIDQVFVRLIDDGCGFDPAVGHRNGLATMRERALGIGAQLRINSAPGRTVIEIELAV